MNFAFVSMEFQELGFPLKNENALVILNEDNQPSHVAHEGVFKELGRGFLEGIGKERREEIINDPKYQEMLSDPNFRVSQFEPRSRAKIIRGIEHSDLPLDYESWETKTIFGEDVELYNPISVPPFENPQKKLVFADITVYADNLYNANVNYGRKDRVRNKSALVYINVESEKIIFVAQAQKFRKVSPEELVVHKLPQDPNNLTYRVYPIEFDHLSWSWEKT